MGHRHSVTEDPLKLAGIAALAAAIGATVALLFTPRSGEQVRRGLKRRADNIKDDVQDRFARTSDEAADVADDAKQRLQTTATKVARDAKSTVRKVNRDTQATKSRAKSAAGAAKKPARRRPNSQ